MDLGCIGCVWFKVGCNGYPSEVAKCKSEAKKPQE